MGITIEETHGNIHRVTWRINSENKTSGQINKTVPFARWRAAPTMGRQLPAKIERLFRITIVNRALFG
jgi:hypothetical protein